MRSSYDVLIVGTGHAGAQAAIALRQHGFAGTIGLLGAEPDLPYERPPLSKDYLAGGKPFERILIRPAAFWVDKAIGLLPGREVVGVNAGARQVTLADGATLDYGALIWAAGGAARRLSCGGFDGSGVHGIRTRADVDVLIGELHDAQHVVVVGGGYVGLEAAAVLIGRGKQVTLLEAQDRVLARVAAEPLSRFYEAEHRARGVDVRLGVTVERIEIENGRVARVRLAGGDTLPADLVIVGIGIVPAVAPLLAAGADGGDGVRVDEYCRTSLPHIYAVGDCALHANRHADNRAVRVESVQNANDQATVAARHIAGNPLPYDAVPWFWSNQYDLRLQTVGLSAGHDEIVVRGDSGARSFSLIYLRNGRVAALDCVNATKDFVAGRMLVLAGTACDPTALADPDVPLKTLAVTAQARPDTASASTPN